MILTVSAIALVRWARWPAAIRAIALVRRAGWPAAIRAIALVRRAGWSVPIRGALLAGLACAASTIAPLGAARADVFGPDESISAAAGPLVAETAYTGAFSSAQDIDYLYFDVPQPETLRFDIANTLASCRPYAIQPAAPGEAPLYEPFPTCPMWATLVDSSGQQLGGEGSSAGSGPIEYASYEYVEWTFSEPGRYYVVLESEYCGGHPSECQLPTFKLSFAVVPPAASGGGSTGGGSTGGGSAGGGSGGAGAGGATGSKGGGSPGASGGAQGGAPKNGEVGVVGGRASGSFTLTGTRSLIESLTLARRQRGRRVRLTVVLSSPLASLDLQLLARARPRHRLTVVGHRIRRHPIAGRETIDVPVQAGGWLSGRRYIPLVLRVRALAANGAAELVQGRLLLRR